MYRIYINEAVLIISESISASFEDCQQIQTGDFKFIQFYKHIISENSISKYFILTDDAKCVFVKIKNTLKTIRAAGGLVRNEKGDYLFIFRKGKWDLPKGKIEIGEKVAQAALREVEEECGIQEIQLGSRIGETYHVYKIFGELVLKQTTWYHMYVTSWFKLKPQLEEGITDVRWISISNLSKIENNTYPSIKEVICIIKN